VAQKASKQDVAAGEAGHAEAPPEEEEEAKAGNVVTPGRLKGIITKLTTNFSVENLKRFLHIFTSGVNLDEGDSKKKALIQSTQTFEELMVFGFEDLPTLLQNHLLTSSKKKKTPSLDEGRLKKMQHILKHYLSNYIRFLDKLSDKKMVLFILSHAIPLSTFAHRLKPYDMKLLKTLTKIWCNYEMGQSQLFAFMLIREIAKQSQPHDSTPHYFTKILKVEDRLTPIDVLQGVFGELEIAGVEEL
jgi:hypothetical protein